MHRMVLQMDYTVESQRRSESRDQCWQQLDSECDCIVLFSCITDGHNVVVQPDWYNMHSQYIQVGVQHLARISLLLVSTLASTLNGVCFSSVYYYYIEFATMQLATCISIIGKSRKNNKYKNIWGESPIRIPRRCESLIAKVTHLKHLAT